MITDRAVPAIEDIVTPRLTLRLMPAEAVTACLAGDLAEASRITGTAIPHELLEDPGALEYGQMRLNEDPDYLPWSVRAIILTGERRMIGHIRFHTRPDPDYLQSYARHAVEFGYLIFNDDRGQGYASEAAEAVMDWARDVHGVQFFAASVSPENPPSLRIVQRLGFAKVGEEMDEIDGIEYVFLRAAR
ncbi:GNAT family N-acetyltransferase [Phyllobacterium myrsinacearum]|nr:GNAT family protein [Phyllobacterium myrsinacearum]